MTKWTLPEGRKPLTDADTAPDPLSDPRVKALEAKLAKAVKLIDLAVELAKWDLNPKLRDDMIDFTTELKGQDDE